LILADSSGWNSAPVGVGLQGFYYRPLDVLDINGDGQLDLMSTYMWHISAPDSVGVYNDYQLTPLGGVNYADYRLFTNMDCDPGIELIGKGLNVGNCFFTTIDFEGDSIRYEGISQWNPYISSNVPRAAADINRDGAVDIIVRAFSQTVTVTHYNLAVTPSVSLTLPFMALPNGMDAALSGGLPAGGAYSGDGVVGDSLFSGLTSGGPITITYSYSNEWGCADSAQAIVDIVTGLTMPNAGLSQVLVYPNPSTGIMNLQLHADRSGPMSVEVVDVSGRSAGISFTASIQEGHNRLDLNLSQLVPGTYILRLEHEFGMMRVPLQVVR
jgi:hypothetical protein